MKYISVALAVALSVYDSYGYLCIIKTSGMNSILSVLMFSTEKYLIWQVCLSLCL